MLLLAIAIVMFFTAALLLLSGLTVHQRQVAVSLRRAKRYGTRDQREIETRKSVNDRIIGPLTNRLAAVTQRVLPNTDSQQVLERLRQAGLAHSMTPQMYLAIKGGLIGSSFLLGILLGLVGAVPLLVGMLIGLGGSVLGFIAPDFYLNSRLRGRKAEMQAELPNVLDLLSVSVEAGLGFDSALVKLSERMEGPLVDEFALVLHEMRIGESRSAALKNLAERVDVPEVGQFCRAIVQADQLGIALSRILRVQSKDMRVKRQLAAEEKAMKAPVKMLFPTVIFIFPALFVVALGPATLSLMSSFGGGGPH
jgi:tight adherence protein C